MAIWPFNRNKSEPTDLPKEVQDYYQSEKRQRAGVAGLLAVGTLIVTILLALGLFFGGRWVYRTVFNNGDKAETTTQGQEDQGESTDSNAEDGESEPETQVSPPQPTTLPSGENSNSTTPNRSDTPQVSSVTNIPDTGPGDVVAVFVGTVIIGTSVHYTYSRYKFKA